LIFYSTTNINGEVKYTEPSPSVCIPCREP
jgi:hypothetical protein